MSITTIVYTEDIIKISTHNLLHISLIASVMFLFYSQTDQLASLNIFLYKIYDPLNN
jgi:hypothetical protein